MSLFVKICLFLSGVVLSMSIIRCAPRHQEHLNNIESLVEEHPDSALILLEHIHVSENTSKEEVALHDFLLSYARYKNFIDDKDDSRIKRIC